MTISPNVDAAAVLGHCHFPAKRSWRFFPAAVPSAFGTENIMIARYAHLHAVISVESHIQPLAEQLFPAVVAVGCCWIGRILFEAYIRSIALVILWIDASRRRIEDPPRIAPVA